MARGEIGGESIEVRFDFGDGCAWLLGKSGLAPFGTRGGGIRQGVQAKKILSLFVYGRKNWRKVAH